MSILLRPSTPADAADIARLILLSAEHFLPAVFGPRIEAGIARLAAREGTLFSWTHVVIAAAEGRTAGMLLGYSGRDKAHEDPATGIGLLRAFGGVIILRLGKLLIVQRMIGTIAAGEWYVSNVAVLPEMRGRGTGRALMLDAEQRARNSGAVSIVLDVETDHLPAIRLYQGLGYETVSTTPALLLDGRSVVFHRMGKTCRP